MMMMTTNDDDHDETTPFWPGSASTPGPGGEEIPIQTMHHEDTSYDEIPSLGSFVHQDDKPAILERAKEFIKRKFPRVYFGKLGPTGFSKKSGNETTIVSLGSRGGETEIFNKDGSGLLKKFTDKFKTALGPEAEYVTGQENEKIGDKAEFKRSRKTTARGRKALFSKRKSCSRSAKSENQTRPNASKD